MTPPDEPVRTHADRIALPPSAWSQSPAHRTWAWAQAMTLLDFFRPMLDGDGWFCELDDDGRPAPSPGSRHQDVLTVARAVHTYAVGRIMGVPGGDRLVRAGLDALWERHRDTAAGGYFAVVGEDGPVDATKSAYNHAFVLLAASTALTAGYPAEQLYDDALATIDEHFWSDQEGASSEAYGREWDEVEPYRGANSNMHLTESFLAAAEAGHRPDLSQRAARIAAKLIDGHARANGWLLPEHYTTGWQPVPGYNRDRLDDRFRPYGATIGHSLEWARLVVIAGLATGELAHGWWLPAAEALFARAVERGWDSEHGGLAYTVDWDGSPANPDHYWWPVAEGIGTSAYLLAVTGKPLYEQWYRRFWEYASEVLIDHARGGWYPVFDAENNKKGRPWDGKPDVYHAFQACMLPLLPLAPSLAAAAEAAARGHGPA